MLHRISNISKIWTSLVQDFASAQTKCLSTHQQDSINVKKQSYIWISEKSRTWKWNWTQWSANIIHLNWTQSNISKEPRKYNVLNLNMFCKIYAYTLIKSRQAIFEREIREILRYQFTAKSTLLSVKIQLRFFLYTRYEEN